MLETDCSDRSSGRLEDKCGVGTRLTTLRTPEACDIMCTTFVYIIYCLFFDSIPQIKILITGTKPTQATTMVARTKQMLHYNFDSELVEVLVALINDHVFIPERSHWQSVKNARYFQSLMM